MFLSNATHWLTGCLLQEPSHRNNLHLTHEVYFDLIQGLRAAGFTVTKHEDVEEMHSAVLASLPSSTNVTGSMQFTKVLLAHRYRGALAPQHHSSTAELDAEGENRNQAPEDDLEGLYADSELDYDPDYDELSEHSDSDHAQEMTEAELVCSPVDSCRQEDLRNCTAV